MAKLDRLDYDLLKFRKNILADAGDYYYPKSGEFFDLTTKGNGIKLDGLGFDESKTTDNITIKEVEQKMEGAMYTVKDYDEPKFKQYKDLKEYIKLKNSIGELNLPDVKSFKVRKEYQK